MKNFLNLGLLLTSSLLLLACNDEKAKRTVKTPPDVVILPIPADGPFPSWEPSSIDDCRSGENVSPVLDRARLHLREKNQELKEPSILFEDQTFTVMMRGSSSNNTIIYAPLANGTFASKIDSSSNKLFDDGTHGDVTANDGVFTRDCLYLNKDIQNETYIHENNIRFINTKYRGSAPVTTVSERLRVNDSGMFIALREDYDMRFQGTWSLHNPARCIACEEAWSLAGDVFDFFVMTIREEVGGQGYTRVHDNITGTGFEPPYEPNSHGFTISDGKEHQEYLGVISMDSPEFIGLSHELGHGLLGIETINFPEPGNGQWNVGDGMHLDSDTTLTGDLQGPFWDPARGWPYPVKLQLENGDEVEVYLTQKADGSFHLTPQNDERFIWSDILLYMMGLKQAHEVTESYYKLVNPILENCRSDRDALRCSNTKVDAERVIRFTVDDFLAQYGVWGTEYPFDPKNIRLGVLNVSDRPHTQAEIVWFSNSFRDYVTNDGSARGDWIKDARWSYITKGLSTIITDINKMKPLN
ncbi:choice-of-anchor X domain-containing protein [Thalassotalea ganghwensis]